MLKQLTINNYALIQKLEMSPSNQLNIITGETGAGKSIMLGAVGLLLGNRADTKVLFDEEQKCFIEGIFEIAEYKLKTLFDEEELEYDSEAIIRREISPSGKSRAFINDTPVTLDVLKKLGEKLMDVHSQHDNLKISQQLYQLSVLDIFAGNDQEIAEYQNAFRQYKSTKKEFQKLLEEAKRLKEESDFVKFQHEELEKANLVDGEQEKLEQELEQLENAEEIKLKLNGIMAVLDKGEASGLLQIAEAQSLAKSLSKFGHNYSEIETRLLSALIELRDITAEAEKLEEKIAYDPELIAATKDRLSLIFSLQQKHRLASVNELLVLKKSLAEKVGRTNDIEDALVLADRNCKIAHDNVIAKGKVLTKSRLQVIPELVSALEVLLRQLGMPDAVFQVSLDSIEADAMGYDAVNFLFSANKGIAPQDIRQVASGGEFSRLMFCIKYVLADKTALPTIIFDEIDTGISGEVAKKMAAMMKQMADNHQVISISHLPQFAAQGDAHYFVYKDNTQAKTVSKMKLLDNEERIMEIAKMIDGENPSAAALASAKGLINHQ